MTGPESAPPQPRGSAQRATGLVVASAGLVGVAIGTFYAFRAKSAYDSSNKDGHCLADNECDATGKDDRSSAKSMATVATVAMGVGAAALAAGAVLYFTAPSDAARVALAPAVDTRGASLAFLGRF
jgi:serine/threonine-protein kinase